MPVRALSCVRAWLLAPIDRNRRASMNANTLQLLLYAAASALLPYIAAIALIAAGR
jgi:hypothetical protein